MIAVRAARRPGGRVRAAMAAAAIVAPAALLAAGCADTAPTRDVRVTIVDEAGTPVPGALFYAEVRDTAGPFAFVFRVAGHAGEVPDSAYEPLKLPWRRGARVSMAAFAPGHRTAVMRFPSARPRTDGAVLTLPAGPSPWNPELAGLAFPFEDAADLAARLRDGDFAPLLEAFREAWRARPSDPASPPTPEDLRKMADLGLS